MIQVIKVNKELMYTVTWLLVHRQALKCQSIKVSQLLNLIRPLIPAFCSCFLIYPIQNLATKISNVLCY